MTTSTKPIQAATAKFAAQIESALLDGHGQLEDVLANPRFTLTIVIKAVNNTSLINDSTAIVLIGDIQCRLSAWLAKIDAVLPRQKREMTLREATSTLVEILHEVPATIDDLKRLEKYLSPLSIWN
ncbi:hypothetical protein PQR75_13670 [Paraburkholderia fungorum]|uniref:hypothetical protein n=1 Tax=Paraburkholderia fungorum TaxID=134537 RepID=UPI0038B7B224